MSDQSKLAPEHLLVLELLARSSATVVDIASDIDLPLGVVRILLADLRELGLIAISTPVMTTARSAGDHYTLKAVLDGLRRL